MIKELVRNNILVAEKDDELKIILEENKEHIKNSTHLYMVIQPTAACPLGCGYCGQKHDNKNMNETAQKATLMRLEDKLKSGSYKSMAITWFGAERLVGLKVIKNLSLKIYCFGPKI